MHMAELYIEDSLMFQPEWEEVFQGFYKHFDPVAAMMSLVAGPENQTTPALFSKLARFISHSPGEVINSTWQQIQNETQGDYHQTVKAT